MTAPAPRTVNAPPAHAAGAPRQEGSASHIAPLDGLRGIAVLVVALSHATPFAPETGVERLFLFGMRAGWVGVDLFFVLSGFLITGILLDAKGHPGLLGRFYARRFLRIVPVYYAFLFGLTLVVTTIDALEPASYQDFTAHLGAYFGYLVNFVVAGRGRWEAGPYFTHHLWSLALEEQFYLVWPLLVLLLPRRGVAVAGVVAFAASEALRLAMHAKGYDSSSVYHFPLARLGGLGAGAFVAAVARGPVGIAPLARHAKRAALGGIGVAVLAALAQGNLLTGEPLSQLVALPALEVAFAGVVVHCLHAPASRLSRALSASPLRTVGRYSYAIYVFHFPLYFLLLWAGFPDAAFARGPLARIAGHLLFAGIGFFGAFSAAWVAWHLFEKRLLFYKDLFPLSPAAAGPRPSRRGLAAWVVVVLALPVASFALVRTARTARATPPQDDRPRCEAIEPRELTVAPGASAMLEARFAGRGFTELAWTTTAGELAGELGGPAGASLPGFVVLGGLDRREGERALFQPTLPAGATLADFEDTLTTTLPGPASVDLVARVESRYPLQGDFDVELVVASLSAERDRAAVSLELVLEDGFRPHLQVVRSDAKLAVEANAQNPDGGWQSSTGTMVHEGPLRLRLRRHADRVVYSATMLDDGTHGESIQVVSRAPARIAIETWSLGDHPAVTSVVRALRVSHHTSVAFHAPADAPPGTRVDVGLGAGCEASARIEP